MKDNIKKSIIAELKRKLEEGIEVEKVKVALRNFGVNNVDTEYNEL